MYLFPKKIESVEYESLLRYLMLFGFCFDLSGHFGLRSILVFPISLYFLIKNLQNFKDTRRVFYLLFILIIFPLFEVVNGFAANGDNGLIISQFLATFQMFIIYLCFKNTSGEILLKELTNTLLSVQIISLIVFFGGLAHIGVFLSIIEYLGTPFDGGYFGFLQVGGFTVPQVYFKSTLFFIFTAVYFFSINNHKKSVVSLLALLLALSKSGIILAIIGILILVFRKRRLNDVWYVFVFIAGVLFFGDNYLSKFYELKDSYTAEVRFQQLEWFKSWIINEPLKFLFGSGLGTSVYIPNYGVVSALELDHIDTIRKYGFVWFLIVFFILVVIFVKLLIKKKNFGVSLAFILTLVGVGTNPLLITSLFFIISLIAYKLTYE